jgi:glycosyltransferase involved in cell wall biosynthesis
VNILITTGIYPPDVGGPARFVPLIAEKLSNKNNVKVITLSQDLSILDEPDYQVIRILRRQNKFIRFFKTVFQIVKFGRKSDVIFINGLWLETYIANLFIRKNTIRKIVGDPVWEKYFSKYKVTEEFDEFQSKKYNISIELYKFLRNVSIKSVNTIIVPSNHLSNFIKNIGFSGNLIQINNGTKKSTDIEKIYDENNFLIVSRLVRHKNIDLIIRSFNDLKKQDSLDFKLNIIGEGPEYKKIKNLIEQFNLSDSISLVGSKFGNELEEYYKNSNYFLQMSSYEGMPHSILEAMNHKLIVIASKHGGNYELIGNNDFGYIVESLETGHITDSIKNAINDNQNQTLASKGKYLVNQEYNIELTTQKYTEIILK